MLLLNLATADQEGIYIHFNDVDQDLEDKLNDGNCRVLAMRGGGTKGAYEVGALKIMVDMLDP